MEGRRLVRLGRHDVVLLIFELTSCGLAEQPLEGLPGLAGMLHGFRLVEVCRRSCGNERDHAHA